MPLKTVLNCDKAPYNSYLDMYGSSLINPCVHALENYGISERRLLLVITVIHS